MHGAFLANKKLLRRSQRMDQGKENTLAKNTVSVIQHYFVLSI